MAKDPAILFYPNDYIGGTMGMTFEEKGAYMELLMLQFNRGHMTSDMIAQTVGQLWEKLKIKFSQDQNGDFFNERFEYEQRRRKSYSDSRRNNLTGKNQYSKTGHTTTRMENENVNEDLNEKESVNEIEVWPTFDDFWNTYDKKSGNKIDSLKKWDKIDQKLKEAIMTHVFAYVRSTPDPQFRKNPETYLNQKHYHNEILINDNGKTNDLEAEMLLRKNIQI